MTNELMTVSEQISSVLMRGLEKTGGYIDNAVEFTVEQAPMVVQEFLQWEFWSSALTAVILLTIIGIFVLIHSRLMAWARNPKNYESYGHPGYIVPTIIMGIVSCVFIPIIVMYSFSAVKVKVAPRVYLIEKCAELVNHRQ